MNAPIPTLQEMAERFREHAQALRKQAEELERDADAIDPRKPIWRVRDRGAA